MKTIREKKLLCFKPFLDDIVEGKRPLRFKRKQRIYSQGDPADSVFFIEEGKAILTVVSSSGKEATLGVLHPGDFLGEGCLNEQPFRTHTATTWEPSLLVRIEKNALSQALHNNSTLAEALSASCWLTTSSFKKICVPSYLIIAKNAWRAFFSSSLTLVRRDRSQSR